MSLKFLGHYVLFVQKIWDGLSVPKGYFVLGTFCPKDRSVAGTLQPGTLCPRTFRQGTNIGSATHCSINALCCTCTVYYASLNQRLSFES
jgi:hypothetical protein